MKSNSNSNRKPHAIVFGLDTTNGLQTARILAKRGIPVIGIARDPKHHYCTTNVCEDIIFTETESDELVEALAHRCSSVAKRPEPFLGGLDAEALELDEC